LIDGAIVKNAIRALLVLVFLFTAQLGYGLSLNGLIGPAATTQTPLTEPASLVAFGFAMLLFAAVARRRPGSTQGTAITLQ